MTSVDAGTTDETRYAAEAETVKRLSEAGASQDALTQSVGQRMTGERQDAQQPRWKRWFGKG